VCEPKDFVTARIEMTASRFGSSRGAACRAACSVVLRRPDRWCLPYPARDH
jgi:hypothetical protein